MVRKISAALMALVLVVGLCPATAFASGVELAAVGGTSEALTTQATSGDLAVSKKGKKRVSLKKCKVKLAKKSYRYTGKKIKPKVTVKYKGKKLRKGRDYRVVYKNAKGKKVSAPKAVGTYKVIVKGKGSFKGKVVKKVKVRKPSVISTEAFSFEKPAAWVGQVNKTVTVNDGTWNTGKVLHISDKNTQYSSFLHIHYCETSNYREMSGWGNVGLVGVKSGPTYTVAVYCGIGAGWSNSFYATHMIELATCGEIPEGSYTTLSDVGSTMERVLREKVLDTMVVY